MKFEPARVISPPVVVTVLLSVTLPPARTIKLPLKFDAPFPNVIALASRKFTFLAPLILTVEKLLATLLAVTSPAPTILRLFAAVTTPFNVSVDAAEVVPIALLLAVITLPAKTAAPVPVRAPTALTPVPLSVIASAAKFTLFTLSVAPLATVVPVATVPSAVAVAAVNVPVLTVVAPV